MRTGEEMAEVEVAVVSGGQMTDECPPRSQKRTES
jgi:hypothetical protein